jgi:hypothetical protein
MCYLLSDSSLVLNNVSWQLGSKFGTWLLERGLTPKYGYMGTTKEGACHVSYKSWILCTKKVTLGCGGLQEQIPYQGLDPQCTWFVSFLRSLYLCSSRSDYCQDQNAFALDIWGLRERNVWGSSCVVNGVYR